MHDVRSINNAEFLFMTEGGWEGKGREVNVEVENVGREEGKADYQGRGREKRALGCLLGEREEVNCRVE